MQTKTLISTEHGKVWATAAQAEALQALTQTRKGGFARVYGYMPSTGYVVPPVQDIVVVTRFSVEKLYDRKTKALNAISFNDVKPAIAKNAKLAALTVQEQEDLFNERKAGMVASMAQTAAGDRSDAHRQGHDRCYLHLAEGVKVNYDTVKVDGLMQPVLTDGFPTVASIMLTCLENSKFVRVEGQSKPAPNSGTPVLMGNAIESLLNKKSVGIKTISLKEGNFERLAIDGEVILTEDVAGLV